MSFVNFAFAPQLLASESSYQHFLPDAINSYAHVCVYPTEPSTEQSAVHGPPSSPQPTAHRAVHGSSPYRTCSFLTHHPTPVSAHHPTSAYWSLPPPLRTTNAHAHAGLLIGCWWTGTPSSLPCLPPFALLLLHLQPPAGGIYVRGVEEEGGDEEAD